MVVRYHGHGLRRQLGRQRPSAPHFSHSRLLRLETVYLGGCHFHQRAPLMLIICLLDVAEHTTFTLRHNSGLKYTTNTKAKPHQRLKMLKNPENNFFNVLY